METKKVTFGCPQHGLLQETVEYISVDFGAKRYIDIPVMQCPQCKQYYTPFNNFLKLFPLEYKGAPVRASQGSVVRSAPRICVRTPRLVDIAEAQQIQSQLYYEEQKKQAQMIAEKKAQAKQYFDSLPEVFNDCIILTNKSCFLREKKCPCCHEKTTRRHVKISQNRKYLLATIDYCNHCELDLISPKQFEKLCDKAFEKIRGYFSSPFISPCEMNVEIQNEKYLFIPNWAIDYEKYDHHHLPPTGDTFYDMTGEEYNWVKEYYQPQEFTAKLRQKSFLGEAGYSTSESEIRRHLILQRCVKEYGKDRVVRQLNSNMNLRLRQKDGEIRYEHCLNIYRSDLIYIEKELSNE